MKELNDVKKSKSLGKITFVAVAGSLLLIGAAIAADVTGMHGISTIACAVGSLALLTSAYWSRNANKEMIECLFDVKKEVMHKLDEEL